VNQWNTVQLGDVAEFIRGINFKPEDVVQVDAPGAIACMRTKNVQTELDCADVWAVDERFVKREDQYLAAGDILVSSANSWNLVGKCCWVPDLPWPATLGGFVSVLRSHRAKVDPQYLYRWFSSDQVQTKVRTLGQQTTNISNLNTDRCLKLPLPLPSLIEQGRIAEILDRADGLRAARRTALIQLEELNHAIFINLFGDGPQTPVTIGEKLQDHPEGWRWELLTDVARLATGHTPDRKRRDYWNGKIPWITLSEIRKFDGTIAEDTAEHVTDLGIENSAAVKLPTGTVCFSRTASLGFVTMMGREMATSQDFVNWVCGERVNPMYLMHALLRSRKRLRSLSTGSTHKTIYFPTVEQFRVLVPPIDIQHEFARRVAAAEKLRTAQRASLAEMDLLFGSLQYKAFKGEL
jgi:type I restriction enzyme S subunit